jgi:hypothetical protein
MQEPKPVDRLGRLLIEIADLPHAKRNYAAPRMLATALLIQSRDRLSSVQAEALDLAEFGERGFKRVFRGWRLLSKLYNEGQKLRSVGQGEGVSSALNELSIMAIGDAEVSDIRFLGDFVGCAVDLGLTEDEVESMLRDFFGL